MILTSGTELTNWEYEYVLKALDNIGTKDFNYFVPKFTEEFRKYTGAKYAVPLTNGTNALFLGLLALGIGKGDEVITPDLGYIVTANTIAQVGAKPILVDIDPLNWCISPEAISKAITKRTKAIMPVWMYGNAPQMDEIMAIADVYDLKVIEDACPAVGSFYGDKHSGTWGDVGCFSFQGAKLLAIGEGGMAVTDNEQVADKIWKLATNGRSTTKEFWHDEPGYMAKLSEIQAALGLGQLKHIDELLMKKKRLVKWYREGGLGEINMNYEGAEPNYWMPSILVENRDKVRKYLLKKGIDTRPFFYPISEMFYKTKYDTSNSYNIGHHGINLPSGVKLTKKQVKYICKKVLEVI